ncbi:GatB/GatE catalytic domain-containing protein [Haematococcus lacustris]
MSSGFFACQVCAARATSLNAYSTLGSVCQTLKLPVFNVLRAIRAMQSTRLRWKSGGCMLRQSLAHPRWIEGGSPGFQCQAIGIHRSTLYNPLAHRRSRHELTHLTPASLTSTAAVCTAPPDSVEVEYESVIGIEAHVQLLTRTKAFCNCASSYGEEPNTSICPICMGHPGTLPVPNQEAVKLAIRAGFALGCHIAQCSKFDRKQYFYADLPKGYQISQFDEPICTGGQVLVDMSDGTTKRFGITRAHLEEDSGKTVYGGSDRLAGSDYALCDFNRAGVPLLEIVSEPDMRSGRDAYMYGDELRRVLRFCGVSDGNMAEGSMRCDVNISVRPKGQAQFGTKVEIKNMNSFSNMQKAIDYEYERQVALLRAGREAEVVQETRLWDEFKLVTYSMRRKEGNVDYRYFPEPDLPPLVVSDELLREVQASMPELPAARRRRYSQLGLPMADVLQLAEEPVIARMFDGVLATGVAPKLAANWIVGDIQAYCKEKKCSMDALQLTPAALAEMIQLIDTGVISGRIAKEILPDLLQGKGNAGVRAYVEGRGMLMITDQAVVAAMVDKVLSASPKQLAEYRAGKVKLMAFFEGQLMKESRGRVDPRVMKAVLVDKLSAPA